MRDRLLPFAASRRMRSSASYALTRPGRVSAAIVLLTAGVANDDPDHVAQPLNVTGAAPPRLTGPVR